MLQELQNELDTSVKSTQLLTEEYELHLAVSGPPIRHAYVGGADRHAVPPQEIQNELELNWKAKQQLTAEYELHLTVSSPY